MEHRIRKVIAANRDKQGFPRLEDYGIEEEDFDDYLFYKQAVIDDVDSLRKKYTVYSIIFIIPFLVMSFYETTITNLFIAIGAGAALCLIYYIITVLINYIRMKRLHNENIERYIEDVLKFE